MLQDEGTLDTWVADWIDANGAMMEPPDGITPEFPAAAGAYQRIGTWLREAFERLGTS